MPIYEYQCQACGRRHEQIQRLDDLPLAVCPDCGGPLKKMVSSPAFQFKGTGWYATDYATKKGAGPDGAKSSGKGEGAEQSSGQNSEKSSEPSSATSTEAKTSSDSKSTAAADTSARKESPKAADS